MASVTSKPESPDLSLDELAELLRVHPETIRRKARASEIPGAYRFGGLWRFRREAIDRIRGISEAVE